MAKPENAPIPLPENSPSPCVAPIPRAEEAILKRRRPLVRPAWAALGAERAGESLLRDMEDGEEWKQSEGLPISRRISDIKDISLMIKNRELIICLINQWDLSRCQTPQTQSMKSRNIKVLCPKTLHNVLKIWGRGGRGLKLTPRPGS